MSSVPRIAIACQGGGSLAVFGTGVLLELLQPERRRTFDLIALSGTSGGAMSAALVWRGLVASGADEAARRLAEFWHSISARDLADAVGAFWDVWLARLPIAVNVPPYLAWPLVERRLRRHLRDHLELETLTLDPVRRERPRLFIGATDVVNGDRVIFQGRTLKYEHLLASAAVPPMFRAVNADSHWCWDGLFTTNPPVREFTDIDEPPDEIWVIQVNPQRRPREPRSMREVKDRTNELSGNLSLGQELYFIQKINQLRQAHSELRSQYRHIGIRVVQLDSELLDFPFKLERRRDFFERLMASGRERAAWFFDSRSEWPREPTVPARAVHSIVHTSSAGSQR